MAENPRILELEQTVHRLETELNEQRNTAEQLRLSELWKNNILNSLKSAVLMVTPDRKMTNANESTVRMFGYSREELANLSTEVLHVDREYYETFGSII